MTMRKHLLFAFTGWIAGLCSVLGVGLLIFPAVVGIDHSLANEVDLLILGLVALLVSPAALVGGLIGGRLPREGGQSSQLITAAILGVVAAVPFSCAGFWFTGW